MSTHPAVPSAQSHATRSASRPLLGKGSELVFMTRVSEPPNKFLIIMSLVSSSLGTLVVDTLRGTIESALIVITVSVTYLKWFSGWSNWRPRNYSSLLCLLWMMVFQSIEHVVCHSLSTLWLPISFYFMTLLDQNLLIQFHLSTKRLHRVNSSSSWSLRIRGLDN